MQRTTANLHLALLLIAVSCTTSSAATLTVTNDIVLHLKAWKGTLDAGGNPATNGVAVHQWLDQGPLGEDFISTSEPRRPIYQDGIASNGMPGLYWDGANDTLVNFSMSITAGTIFVAFKPFGTIEASPPAQCLFGGPAGYRETIELGDHSGNFTDEIIGTRSRNTAGTVTQSAYETPTDTISGVTYISVVHNTTDGGKDIYINGTSVRNHKVLTDDDPFVLTNEIGYIASRAIDQSPYKGHIFEILMYSSVLNGTDRQTVEQYLDDQHFDTNRTITVAAGGHGSISPAGAVQTQVGQTVSFDITAGWGYHIADIQVDGVSIDLVDLGINPKTHTYVWADVIEDGTLDVTFEPDVQELTVTGGLAVWLTSTTGMLDGGGAPASVGDEVQTWQDQSGNSRDFTPTSAGRRPLLEDAVSPNGTQGLRFDGNSDTVRHLATLTMNSFIIAFAPTGTITSATPPSTYLMNGAGIYDESLQLGQFTGTYVGEIFGLRSKQAGGSGIQSAYTNTAGSIAGFTIIALIHDSGNQKWELYLEGDNSKSISGTDDTGFALSSQYLYLGSASNLGDFFGGHMFEVLAYTSALSDADRESVESYLKFKFTNLPPQGSVIVVR